MALTKSMEDVLEGVFGGYYFNYVIQKDCYTIHPSDKRRLKAAQELQDLGIVTISVDEESSVRWYQVKAGMKGFFDRKIARLEDQS